MNDILERMGDINAALPPEPATVELTPKHAACTMEIEEAAPKKVKKPVFSNLPEVIDCGEVEILWQNKKYTLDCDSVADLLNKAMNQLITPGQLSDLIVDSYIAGDNDTPVAAGIESVDIDRTYEGFLDRLNVNIYKHEVFIVNSSDILGIQLLDFSSELARTLTELMHDCYLSSKHISPARVFVELTTNETVAELINTTDDGVTYIDYNVNIDDSTNDDNCAELRDALENIAMDLLHVHEYVKDRWHDDIMLAIDKSIIGSYIDKI